MAAWQKFLLVLFLIGTVTVILTTWGSIASAVLTMALLIVIGYLLIRWWFETHDPDDFKWEE